MRFHSINFPSEWGVGLLYSLDMALLVSIQLISPASGGEYKVTKYGNFVGAQSVSIQLISPASGGELSRTRTGLWGSTVPFN